MSNIRLSILVAILISLVCGACSAITVSGYVRDLDGVAMSNINVLATGGISAKTDATGAYSLTLTAPYTGVVGPESLCQFFPVQYKYENLETDVTDQNFAGSPLIFGISHLSTVLSYYSVSRGAAAWGDYNNSGTLDVVLAGYGVTTSPSALGPVARVFRGDGASNFSDIKTSLTGVTDAALAWGDYDNDGKLDFVLAGNTGSAYVTKLYYNNGTSFSLATTAVLPGVANGSVAWGDYDNDGKLDLLIAGESASGRIAKIFHNSGGAFTENASVSIPGISECSVEWVDYDNDGLQDFAIAGDTGSGYITQIYHNDGLGMFSDISAGLTGVSFASIAWGDYDSDGAFDLAFAGIDGDNNKITRICRNTATGFVEQDLGLPGVKGDIAWGDCDNDGKIDLALAGDQDLFSCPKVYKNNGNGTFKGYFIENIELSNARIAWGDYGADGKLDIIVMGDQTSGYPCTYLYQNPTAIANTAPSVPTDLATVWSNGSLTMSWAASTDAQTPQQGLSYNIRVGTTAGAGDVFCGMADYSSGYRRIPAVGNAGKNLSWTLTGLFDQDYFWSVQAIDSAFAGSAWAQEATRSSSIAPGVSISEPSVQLTKSGPVTYTITYTDADTVTLSESDIALNKTGTVDATVAVDGSGLATRTVTISNITGDGTLGISIASGTAANGSLISASAGPSSAFSVDNTAPSIGSITFQPILISSGDPVMVRVEVTDEGEVASVTSDGALLTYADANVWTGSFAASAGLGSHSVAIVAQDKAGNSTLNTNSYTVVRSFGLNNRALSDAILGAVSQSYVFTVWGRVQVIDQNSFWLCDGSSGSVKVIATEHGFTNTDYVSARGSLDVSGALPVLNAYVVKKQN